MQLNHSSIGTGVLEGCPLQGCERNLYAGPLSATTSRGIPPKVIRVSYYELPQTCCHDHVHDWWEEAEAPSRSPQASLTFTNTSSIKLVRSSLHRSNLCYNNIVARGLPRSVLRQWDASDLLT